ncbi:MAG TPA: DUF1684 domain-containing protein [Thermoanaerobaculia bacterium]
MVLLFGLLLLVAKAPNSSDADVAAHRREIESWRQQRLAGLKRPDGWLTLVGLSWLEPGENRVGSDPASAVPLPSGQAPARLGVIERGNSGNRFRAEPGVRVTCDGKPATACDLKSDAEDEPTLVQYGSLVFYVIQRGDRLGVRVKDSDAPALRHFRGLDYFPITESLRFVARFEPYDPPRSISVPTILGNSSSESTPGALLFDYEGRTYRLEPVLERGTTDLFVVFGDATNGHETYGGGRFLYAAPPVDGKTVLDFNKAYNPPCVFSPYATCPLPPPQNRLPIRIEAGEKDYEHK